MTDEAIAEARATLAHLPLFAGETIERLRIERLGGLTNLVFRVDAGGRAFCLRIPGKGTEEYIDRRIEAKASKGTAEAEVSPEVLHVDPESGVMVTAFVEGAVTMSPQAFRERAGSPARAGEALRKLHDSGAVFDFRFELFAMIDDYLKILSGKTVDLPEGYHNVLREAEAVRAALDANPLPLAPCHCDPLCENFLDTGQRMWMVDWEYSGMNDPLWDLGDLSVEGEFNADQDAEMLHAYFGREPTACEQGRVVIYKAMCDLLWTLWGLIQHANQNPVDDFWAYATNRFQRCRVLMQDESFARHLAAVRARD